MKVVYGLDCMKCGKRFQTEDPTALYCKECSIDVPDQTPEKKQEKKKGEK